MTQALKKQIVLVFSKEHWKARFKTGGDLIFDSKFSTDAFNFQLTLIVFIHLEEAKMKLKIKKVLLKTSERWPLRQSSLKKMR